MTKSSRKTNTKRIAKDVNKGSAKKNFGKSKSEKAWTTSRKSSMAGNKNMGASSGKTWNFASLSHRKTPR